MPETAFLTRDTIVAIATPPGRGGIGILRLSGPDSLAIGTPLLRLRGPLEPNRARYCEVIEPAAQAQAAAGKLDEAVATFYAAPRSYTGEDVLEIAAHGSPVLLDYLLRATLTLGARLADPGEFTERAFLAGRLDLTQAEAVRDLIDAQTLYQARIAASQMDGALSRRVTPLKQALIRLIAQMEAGIDFAEDDTPTLSGEQFLAAAGPIAQELALLAHSFTHGRLVHSGLTLAIVGAPNVGKSSLFNRLVERERAIVTSTPGTTRDLVIERVSLAGLPIELIDTAGLRIATDEAERFGIEKSREALADADLVLLVLDAGSLAADGEFDPLACRSIEEVAANPGKLSSESGAQQQDGERSALDEAIASRRLVIVVNKCDLIETGSAPGVVSFFEAGESGTLYLQQQLAHIFGELPQAPIVATSAQSGQGLEALRATIERQLQTPALADQGGMLTNLRQHQAVEGAQRSIETALGAPHLPDEMLLLDLYTALRHLDALTGETTSDDVLNLIFSTFCIGK